MSPKLFISYSWSSPEYEQQILNIATDLRGAGVDVILDKWDLREGHDATAFMEKMVADENIKKVAIFCDQIYKSKADGRKGGVGTETQIISAEVYKSQDQSKFVAVVMERDGAGSACVPIYYTSRIYIDLSDAGTFAIEFERLLRWIYDKPLLLKPELGNTPAFLTETEATIRLATAVQARRAQDAIRNNRNNALPATQEYFDTFAAEFEKLRLASGGQDDFDENMVKSIEAFIPYRDEMIDILSNLALYRYGNDTYRLIHRLFEKLLPFLERPPHITRWNPTDFENFAFIVHELYLYAIAILIRHERFEAITTVTSDFFVPSDSRNEEMLPYDRLRGNIRLLEHRNTRLGLRRLSVRADMLKERCSGLPLRFSDIMQADLILFLRSHLASNPRRTWYPETLLYSDENRGAFEIFARARSTGYFENLKKVLGISDKQQLNDLVHGFQSGQRRLPAWDFTEIDLVTLIGLDKLATQP